MTAARPASRIVPAVTDFYSPANRRRFAVWHWTPPGPGPFPLLLLLHGVIDAGGHGWWLNADAPGQILRLVEEGLEAPPVVLMAPDTGAEIGSGYTDWADGTTYAEAFVMEELLPWAERNLPVGAERWVTGLSMGGYGAFLLALRHPGVFDSASATSGFFDPQELVSYLGVDPRRIWTDDAARTRHDVRELIKHPDRRARTRFALDCGAADRLLAHSRHLHGILDGLGLAHGYAEHPGDHDWGYWAAHLADHVNFHAGRPGPLWAAG
jgi:putative tributyrin esterase